MQESIPEKVFQKYDIRGVYPNELNEKVVASIVNVLAQRVFLKGKIVVGRDGRNSSPSLYNATVDTLNGYERLEVVNAGVMTTPMLYFLVNYLQAAGGLMITASHSPKEQNGIKVVREGSIFVGGEEIRTMMP